MHHNKKVLLKSKNSSRSLLQSTYGLATPSERKGKSDVARLGYYYVKFTCHTKQEQKRNWEQNRLLYPLEPKVEENPSRSFGVATPLCFDIAEHKSENYSSVTVPVGTDTAASDCQSDCAVGSEMGKIQPHSCTSNKSLCGIGARPKTTCYVAIGSNASESGLDKSEPLLKSNEASTSKADKRRLKVRHSSEGTSQFFFKTKTDK